MQNSLSYFIMLAKRWAWLIALGIVICAGTTYVVSKRIPPDYQASSTVIIDITSSTSAFDNVNASEQIAPTYAQLLTNSQVLDPVLTHHRGLTLIQLRNMVSAKVQPNTALIEVDVDSSSPDLAAQLANEVSQSFENYANTQLPGSVQILPAEKPLTPIKPKPLTYAGIGALVGLGLAVSLIIIFEWIDDRLARPEELQELLGTETLTIIPRLSRREHTKTAEEIPALAEEYRAFCARLNALQALKPFKLLMITSSRPGEGKSSIAVNTALFLAMTGKRVLLVDADLRHPVLDQRFQLDNRWGLLDGLLQRGNRLEKMLEGQATEIPQLRVLPAGIVSPDSAKLLQSPTANQLFDYFKKAPFDYIIFDTPPLLPVADARILAAHIQAAILIVDASKTPRRVLRRVKYTLNRMHTILLGVVINKGPWPDDSDSRHYLTGTRQSRREIRMPVVPSIPPANYGNTGAMPHPSATEEVVDNDPTIVVSWRQKAGGELS